MESMKNILLKGGGGGGKLQVAPPFDTLWSTHRDSDLMHSSYLYFRLNQHDNAKKMLLDFFIYIFYNSIVTTVEGDLNHKSFNEEYQEMLTSWAIMCS